LRNKPHNRETCEQIDTAVMTRYIPEEQFQLQYKISVRKTSAIGETATTVYIALKKLTGLLQKIPHNARNQKSEIDHVTRFLNPKTTFFPKN
jgi:hypothetical protein